jgi:hypothetical protein
MPNAERRMPNAETTNGGDPYRIAAVVGLAAERFSEAPLTY